MPVPEPGLWGCRGLRATAAALPQGWLGEALLRFGCPEMGAMWDRAIQPGQILRGEGRRWGRRLWGGRC